MRSITAEAKAYGKDVGFFVGNAIRKFDGRRDYKIDGIKLADNKILIRYDGTYSPQALLMHELVHTEWDNPEMQEAKDNILSGLSESDKESVLQNGRYKDYMELYNGDEDAVWEEFVADVFADMNVYTDSYVDTVVDYWYGNEEIDSYSPSEYARSTDTGGNDGNEYSLSGNSFNIPYNEKRQLDDYVLRKNHIADTFKRIDCKEIGNNFYVWKNNSKTDYTVISMTEIDGNEDLIAERRKELKNGNFGIGKKHNVSYEGRGRNGRGSNNMLNAAYQRRKSANENGGISSEQSESDTRRYIAESGGDTQTKYALNTDGENAEFWKEWFDKAKEYGVIPKGENPTRNIAVPKKITSDKVVSRFARTLLEAGVTPDWAVSEFEKAILDGKMTHEVITDKRTLGNVKSEIEKLGFEEALNHWNVLSKRGKKRFNRNG